MPLLEIAGGIAAKTTVSAARPLLLALLDVQDRQLQMLTAIEKDVRRLLEQPWKNARVLVAEAAETRNDDPQRAVYLNEARQALFQAYGNRPEVHPTRAAIAADLAMVLGLLGRREDCYRWSRKAHDEAVTFVTATMPQVQAALNGRAWLEEWVPGIELVQDLFGKRAKDFWGPMKGFITGNEKICFQRLRSSTKRDSSQRMQKKYLRGSELKNT